MHTREECYYAQAYPASCGTRADVLVAIPTKTPVLRYQPSGRSLSFIRHLCQVLCISFPLDAFRSKTLASVSTQSIVSRQFIVPIGYVFRSRSGFSLRLFSFQMREADSDIRILYSLFFPVRGFSSALKFGIPPRIFYSRLHISWPRNDRVDKP
jgi:hypothetical protein